MNETWGTMIALWEKGGTAGETVLQNMRAQRQEMAGMVAEQKKLSEMLDEHKKAAQEQADAEREMYEEAGLGADKYFDKQASELVKKAARWQKAGADRYKVEQWLYNKLGELSTEAYAKEEYAAGQAMDSMQAMSRTLVEHYQEGNQLITEQLDAVGLKIDELDGRSIGLTATFDAGVMTTGIDQLISKLQQLQAVSGAMGNASAGSGESASSSTVDNSSTTTNNVTNEGATIIVQDEVSPSKVVQYAKELDRQEAWG
jgi:hypothetical protein